MTKNKYIYYAIFVLIILGIAYFLYTSTNDELSINYQYSTEGNYYEVNITGLRIIYTYTDYEKIKDKPLCGGGEVPMVLIQSPCWTEDDFIVKEAKLTNQEINYLKNLIEETRIMQLDNYTGPEPGTRCYPHYLKINEKEIVYCSGIHSPSAPEEFNKVVFEIKKLTSQKFFE